MAFATAADLQSLFRRDFSAAELNAAALIVQGVESRARVIGGVARAETIEADPESAKFLAVRDVILMLSAARFPNPEGTTRKQMDNYSVAFGAREFSAEEKAMIRGAFHTGRGPSSTIRTRSAFAP